MGECWHIELPSHMKWTIRSHFLCQTWLHHPATSPNTVWWANVQDKLWAGGESRKSHTLKVCGLWMMWRGAWQNAGMWQAWISVCCQNATTTTLRRRSLCNSHGLKLQGRQVCRIWVLSVFRSRLIQLSKPGYLYIPLCIQIPVSMFPISMCLCESHCLQLRLHTWTLENDG